MQAITKLRRSGLTTSEIEDGAGLSPGVLRHYDKFRKFPGRKTFVCMVEMAEARGLTLLARDFLPPVSEVKCEADSK